MRKFIIMASMLFSLNALSFYNCNFYGVFNVNANCFVSGATSRCVVQNHCGRPMYCRVQAQAVSSYGYFLNGWNEGMVYPGGFLQVFINAANPYADPIVRANAQAQCQF